MDFLSVRLDGRVQMRCVNDSHWENVQMNVSMIVNSTNDKFGLLSDTRDNDQMKTFSDRRTNEERKTNGQRYFHRWVPRQTDRQTNSSGRWSMCEQISRETHIHIEQRGKKTTGWIDLSAPRWSIGPDERSIARDLDLDHHLDPHRLVSRQRWTVTKQWHWAPNASSDFSWHLFSTLDVETTKNVLNWRRKFLPDRIETKWFSRTMKISSNPFSGLSNRPLKKGTIKHLVRWVNGLELCRSRSRSRVICQQRKRKREKSNQALIHWSSGWINRPVDFSFSHLSQKEKWSVWFFFVLEKTRFAAVEQKWVKMIFFNRPKRLFKVSMRWNVNTTRCSTTSFNRWKRRQRTKRINWKKKRIYWESRWTWSI